MSLERHVSLGSSTFRQGATVLLCRNGLARGARPGSESTAYGYRGHSRNLGDPAISAEEAPVRVPADQRSRLAAQGVPGRKSESGAHRRYVQDKGNRDWPEGWWEVRELNSTVEAGEPPRGTRWREGSSGARNRTEG